MVGVLLDLCINIALISLIRNYVFRILIKRNVQMCWLKENQGLKILIKLCFTFVKFGLKQNRNSKILIE